MKIFLDTNVMVAASIRQHPHFARADIVLRRCAQKEQVERLYTFNTGHFQQLATQEFSGKIVSP